MDRRQQGRGAKLANRADQLRFVLRCLCRVLQPDDRRRNRLDDYRVMEDVSTDALQAFLVHIAFPAIHDRANTTMTTLHNRMQRAFDEVVKQGGPQAIPAWIDPLCDWMNGSAAHRACVPMSNGIMTARAAGRHYTSLLKEGAGSLRLLPPSRIGLTTEQLVTPDGTLHDMGLGYGIIFVMGTSSFGHGGYGGSIAYADPVNSLAIAYSKTYSLPYALG